MELSLLEIVNNYASLITGLATVGLAVILIIQTIALKKQTQLASRPKIFPRYLPITCEYCKRWSGTHIILHNVGKGNAIDIHLKFKDTSNGRPLGREISRYSLLTVDIETWDPHTKMYRPEFVDTEIMFPSNRKKFEYTVIGSYRDTNEDIIPAGGKYEYPPKIV